MEPIARTSMNVTLAPILVMPMRAATTMMEVIIVHAMQVIVAMVTVARTSMNVLQQAPIRVMAMQAAPTRLEVIIVHAMQVIVAMEPIARTSMNVLQQAPILVMTMQAATTMMEVIHVNAMQVILATDFPVNHVVWELTNQTLDKHNV